MSDLSELFTGFREFVDVRQDQLVAIEMAVADLDTDDQDNINNFSDLNEYLSEFNISGLINRYHDKSRELQQGNCVLVNAIRGLNLHSFKSVLGDNDFV